MLKNLSNLGSVLNKAELRSIIGGHGHCSRYDQYLCNTLGICAEGCIPSNEQ